MSMHHPPQHMKKNSAHQFHTYGSKRPGYQADEVNVNFNKDQIKNKSKKIIRKMIFKGDHITPKNPKKAMTG